MLVYHRPIKKGEKIMIKKAPWPYAEYAKQYLPFIDKVLDKNLTVLEFGSGGSSIYISRRVKSIVSLEHDPIWFKALMEEIKKEGIKNIDLRLNENYQNSFNCNGKKYDIVSVDICRNSMRDKSIKKGMKCVKRGGMLIFHKGPGFKDEKIIPILKKEGWKKIKQWGKWKDVWRLT